MGARMSALALEPESAPYGWTEAYVLAAALVLGVAAYMKLQSVNREDKELGLAKTARIKAARMNGIGNGNSGDKQNAPPTQDAGGDTPLGAITPIPDHDYRSVVQPKLRPFKPIYHMTMSLRNTTPGELITIDADYLERIELRRSLIASERAGVHGVVPASGGAAAVRELYAYLLGTNLPQRYPSIFTLDSGAGETRNSITGKTFPSTVSELSDEAATAALRVLGETVEEDLFLLVQEPQGHRCVAFMCCFPSGFDPSSKLGLGLDGIHEPVPSYGKIGPSMERFFGKLEYGKPVCRMNWSVQTHGDLHNVASNHIKGEEEIIDPEVDISKTHLRVEHQTLTRLPETRALLFSFKTYLYPLADVKAEGQGPELADAIEGLEKGNAPGMWRYKAAVRWGPKAVEFLRS